MNERIPHGSSRRRSSHRHHSHHRAKRRQAPSKPLLSSYRTGHRVRGNVFSTTTTLSRRKARARVTALLTVVAIAAAATYVWLWTRPVAIVIAAGPSDAVIDYSGSTSATGTLTLGDMKPGSYRFIVHRTGFGTRTVDVSALRFRGARRMVALKPLPQPFRITAEPASARVVVSDAKGTVSDSKGGCSLTVPSGEITVTVTAKGCNSFVRHLFVDAPVNLAVLLDPKGQLVHKLGMIPCAGAPKGVALNPAGTEAWTTILNGPPSIEIFDPVSGKRVGEVDIGKYGAVEIVFSKDGSRAYASQMETAKVFEIDTKSRKVTRSFDTESAWTKVVALSPDGKTLYAANWSGDDVSEIDLKSGKLRRRIPVADTPRGLWPSADGKTLWVASFGVGRLERVDLATGAVKTVFRGGGALRHLVADEKRGLLFASDMAKDCVWVTNMKSGATKRFAKVGHKPNTIDLSPDGHVLFVSNRGENNATSYYLIGPEWGSIMLLDAHTGKPLDGIVGGNQCTALDVSDDGNVLAFSDFLDNRLRVYQVPDFATLASGGGGRSRTLAKDVVK